MLESRHNAAGCKFSHYTILSMLGKGGMGEVWKAKDTKLNRDVAIKTLPEPFATDADRLLRFEREARLLASLNHPGIAAIYGLEESNGTRYLVLELVEGKTLADRLEAGPIPLEESLAIALQIAEAIEAAHEKGVIHRDLKPANIKITPDNKVKVLDFGLAKAFADDDSVRVDHPSNSPTISRAATLHGVILGTAAYMSPEQARGENVDKRADIWAWGVVLHEMLTGRRLFEDKTVSDTLAAVLMKEPDLSDVPLKVRTLLRACLERDPKRRLRDIGEAWRLLENAEQEAPPVGARSSRVAWIAAGALALSTALAVWAPWRSAPERPLRRLELDLGEDVQLRPLTTNPLAGFSTVAVSPDSSRLLYATVSAPAPGAAARGRGAGPLFLRRLDEEKATALPDTNAATNVSFSSDSRWIHYTRGGRVFKISTDGGPAVPVAEVPVNTAASADADGSIFFWGLGGVRRIPPAGGSPAEVTKLEGMETSHLSPEMLPGGEAMLFVASTRNLSSTARNPEQTVIEGVSLADRKRKVLIRGGDYPHYVPGYLLFLRGNTLLAIRFDPKKLETQGNEVPIFNDVSSRFSLSRDGTLVYRKGSVRSREEFVTTPTVTIEWIDAAGKRSPLFDKPGPYTRPALSPDGARLAFLKTEKDSRDEWVYDLRTGRPAKITFGNISVTTSTWIDDERLVLGSGGQGIYLARADGNEPERLMEFPGLLFPTSYSPETRRLAFFSVLPSTQVPSMQVSTVSLSDEGGALKPGKPEPFLTSQFADIHPAFSPDGKWLAYATNKSGRNEVKVRAFPQPASGQGAEVPISIDGGDRPQWARNSPELLYQSGDQILSVRYTVKRDSFLAEDKPRVRVERLGLDSELASLGLDKSWDISPDGRIVVLKPVPSNNAGAPSPSTPETRDHVVVFVENFLDELHRRLP